MGALLPGFLESRAPPGRLPPKLCASSPSQFRAGAALLGRTQQPSASTRPVGSFSLFYFLPLNRVVLEGMAFSERSWQSWANLCALSYQKCTK